MKYIVALVLLLSPVVASCQQVHATLTEQKVCAAQAKKFYNEETTFAATKSATKNEFTSHYDAGSKVCYVRINVTTIEKGEVAVSSYVFDAFEGRNFASYIWFPEKGKKFWENRASRLPNQAD